MTAILTVDFRRRPLPLGDTGMQLAFAEAALAEEALAEEAFAKARARDLIAVGCTAPAVRPQ